MSRAGGAPKTTSVAAWKRVRGVTRRGKCEACVSPRKGIIWPWHQGLARIVWLCEPCGSTMSVIRRMTIADAPLVQGRGPEDPLWVTRDVQGGWSLKCERCKANVRINYAQDDAATRHLVREFDEKFVAIHSDCKPRRL